MKKISLLFAALSAVMAMTAQIKFDDHFADSTLRLDYIFAGNDSLSAIYLEECSVTDGWAGRRSNLDTPFLHGNGTVTLTDTESRQVIYANSFCTLFQEWQHTEEAHNVAKAFEDTRLVPMPLRPVDINIALYDNRGNQLASLTHRLDPADIMIRKAPVTQAEHRYVHYSGPKEQCVDIVIVAEGYTAAEKEKFFADATRGAEALFSHEPFTSMADKFNVLAVATLADDSGPDVPREGVWGRTAHRSHYDTFYSDRYLTTQAIHEINESLSGLPYEHIILMVNTPRYGGGGIFNQVTVCTSDHPTFKKVLVHEFGHAYAGLADEYNYDDASDATYALDVEPWETNITTLVDFDAKWADLVPEGTPIPTPLVPESSDADALWRLSQTVGVYEGAGYQPKGIYRPTQKCRMRDNDVDHFCPVCSRTITAITEWYTSKE